MESVIIEGEDLPGGSCPAAQAPSLGSGPKRDPGHQKRPAALAMWAFKTVAITQPGGSNHTRRLRPGPLVTAQAGFMDASIRSTVAAVSPGFSIG